MFLLTEQILSEGVLRIIQTSQQLLSKFSFFFTRIKDKHSEDEQIIIPLLTSRRNLRKVFFCSTIFSLEECCF